MLAIFRLEQQGLPATAEKIAQRSGKPKRYLEQIIHLLKKDSLLLSTSGRKGGYRLARPADQITLSDIIKATVGSLSVVECVLAPQACEKADECEFRLIYCLITQCVYHVFGKYTLADLSDGELLASVSRDLERAIGDSARSGVISPLTPDLVPKGFRKD